MEGETIDVDSDISNDSEDSLTAVKAQDFHFMLSVILDSFIDPLITKGMLWVVGGN
jgi:SOS-response transcriptional repressor LexA